MKQIMTIETYNQLKAIGDPLRAEMMMYLCEGPYTGQQLSETLDIPRGKIHYHLKELEKNNIIEIVKKEEKNGIVQKFYRSVANGFTISEELLPFHEVDQTTRQIIYSMIDRAKKRVQTAPKEAFEKKNNSENPEDWGYMSTAMEIEASEAQFKQWTNKYFALMDELEKMGEETEEEKNIYYFFNLGFQVQEFAFKKREKKDS
ncbi:ArsR family transcriptional regulator [Oceanobacillus zhaokaii]|uniref:ArsR family transcriptional regulator n=1 Tax=Oceanobacillus zhaokaii TaxID=2052660 RepID=A0A345PDA6_9BACI|nr:winged helix-turn-helix domain-containing protein [Oceanobacillus zhaokaii]AXI07986.1 ArsR family transcriptional regulator [Oceanobacillus zhaokaii]